MKGDLHVLQKSTIHRYRIIFCFFFSLSGNGILQDELEIKKCYKAISLIISSIKKQNESHDEGVQSHTIDYGSELEFQSNRTFEGIFLETKKFKNREEKNAEYIKHLCTPVGSIIFTNAGLSVQGFDANAKFMENMDWDLQKLTNKDSKIEVIRVYHQEDGSKDRNNPTIFYQITRVGSQDFTLTPDTHPEIFSFMSLTDEQKKEDKHYFDTYQDWVEKAESEVK